nr:uncharacterized protein LOC118877447 [Drosophila suzukii]
MYVNIICKYEQSFGSTESIIDFLPVRDHYSFVCVCLAVCLRSADNFMIFAAVPKRGSLGYAGITTATEGSDQRSSRSSLKDTNMGSSTANTFSVTHNLYLRVGGENCCPFFESQFFPDAFPRCLHAED